MNLFELAVKIEADTTEAKKSISEYKKDVMNLAQTYKKQGMDMSSAMKKAYSEIDKSQYETAENSKNDSKKFSDNWVDAGEKVSGIANKIGKGLKTAAKIGAAAIGAAAAGITALTTAAVKNYAEYEQLVGGVDTLFKNASRKVQKYASDAYRTSGMSANDYMANATAFSASLISSLGGDTEKAAEYANRAMVSMSDNANKMGTSLDSIVQTYQSLSRGNMAMLDNLKLGYGGTKAELERLIKDAASYTDIQKEMGITVDKSSMSFDNIVNAIAVVQGKLGIAGATAQEAGTTIEGSVNAMKAAWDNLITGVANKNADLEGLINNLVTSIVGDGTESNLGVLGNIMPAVKQALNGASNLVKQLFPKIVQEVPAIISDNLPVLASAAVAVVQSLANGISGNSGKLVGAIFGAFKSIVGNFPYLIQSFSKLVPSLVTSVLKEIPGAIESIVSALTKGGVVKNLTEAVVKIVQSIADNLPNIIQSIVDAIPKITESVNSAILNNFPALLNAVIQIVLTIVKNLPQIVQMLVDQIGPIVSTIVQVLVENTPAFIAGIAQIIFELVKALPSLVISLKQSIYSVFGSIGKGIVHAWPAFKEGVSELWDKITNWFDGLWDKTKEIGGNIVAGMREGIKSAWNNLVEWFKGLFGDLIGIAKKILGIASPSKVFKKIGGFTAEGFGIGFEDEFAHVKDDMEDALNFGDASVGINSSVRKVGSRVAGMAYGGTSIGNITINIDGAQYNDEQSLAEAIAEAIQGMTDRRSAIYA